MARKPAVGGVIVAVLLLPSAINVATNAFPDEWKKYTWVAIPVALLLALYLIFDALRERRGDVVSRQAGAENDSRLQLWRQKRQPVPVALRRQADALVQLARVLYGRCVGGYVVEATKRLTWFQSVDDWRSRRLELRELMRDDLQSPLAAREQYVMLV
ncbi:hypothetical protein [Amycolatopsis sp. Hca4]|uniref:hypothetical protein n=1 Tax=Amycolatopsis sp. Hca4 TaxID=2742131 RepID=UPI0015926274|nr:hypothetical protein [Amycolatopsis sp. Hca4]QKV74114.1 hypothetical protein HUT10_10300 [Amycolatopsis sp. Hca4]